MSISTSDADQAVRQQWTGSWRWLAVVGLILASCSDPEATGATGAGADAQLDAAAADSSAQDAPIAASNLTLLAVEPPSGSAQGGELVVLRGSGFSAQTQVIFGQTPVPDGDLTVLDSQRLQVLTPPHEPGQVRVEVRVAGEPPRSAALPAGFRFVSDQVIATVTPAEGPLSGGTPVVVRGSGFTGAKAVLFGGKPAIDVQVAGDDELLAITPPGAFGPVAVHVVTPWGTALKPKAFRYTAAPTVTQLKPAAGPTAGGTVTQLTGSGFAAGMAVSIGGQPASVLEVLSSSAASVITPPGSAGPANVVVQTSHGSGTLAGGFVYTGSQGSQQTAILAVTPSSGPLGGGNTVALVAHGLVSASDTTVLIGGKQAKLLSVSAKDHTALLQIPAGKAAGPVDVTLVTSKGSATATGAYAYTDALVVGAIAPASGPVAGGQSIVMTGQGFAKGKVSVQLGALPVAQLKVVSDTTLQAVTPPGAEGYVDVVVNAGGQTAVLAKGYAYSASQFQLFASLPVAGAQAGGTLVHLYGTGFSPEAQVRFGAKSASSLQFVDPSHLMVKTPPGDPGAVDIAVQVGAATAVLPKGFTYFDPMSAYGGTWGSDIDGALNLTVLDAQSGEPIADAYAMLWSDPTTPHQGYTDVRGQITFSGPDVVGKQMVSASKKGYEAASIVLFDAANATLLLTPTPEPSPGNPPPPPPIPHVKGQVIGLDKYVLIPTGLCASNQNPAGLPAGTCGGCGAGDTCGEGLVCTDMGGSNGKRCLPPCTQSCGSQFACQNFAGQGRCAPLAGEPSAVCFHTKQTFLDPDHEPPEGALFEATKVSGYSYDIAVPYGEIAVLCFGGYKPFGAALDAEDPSLFSTFTPTVLGAARHVQVMPNQTYDDVDVTLSIPLQGTLKTRLARPPIWPIEDGAYLATALFLHLDLGSDGVFSWPAQDVKFLAPFMDTDPDRLQLGNIPSALQGVLADASYTLMGLVLEMSDGQLPQSIAVKTGVRDLGDDLLLRQLPGGAIETKPTGVGSSIYGLWGNSADDLTAVGADGQIVHWNGGTWTLQGSLGQGTLTSVWGLGKQAWAVGQAGLSAAFDGLQWKPLAVLNPAEKPQFTGVFAAESPSGPVVWASTSNGLFRLDTQQGKTGWIRHNPSPYNNYLAIHGADASHIWTVGMYGQAAFWNGAVWQSVPTGSAIALRDVWMTSATEAYAVGEAGQILRWTPATGWKPMLSPVDSTLYSVTGAVQDGAQVLYASGAGGVVLRLQDGKWTRIDGGALGKSLHAVFAPPAGGFFALGEQELVLSPLLYPTLPVQPAKDAVLVGQTLQWSVDPDYPEPHFQYIRIGIPGLTGETPVWNIVAKGNVTEVELPDFASVQGGQGLPTGQLLVITLLRVYKEGFDIDHYDLTEINMLNWQSWAMHQYYFQTP